MITGVMIAVVALLALVPTALAQGPQNGQGVFDSGHGMVGGRMGSFGMGQGTFRRGAGLGLRTGGPNESLVAVAAEQLGLERTELIAELQGGKTLAEVVTTHNGDPAKVLENFLAERQADLAELVITGQITQEQADNLLVMMKANATGRLDR